MRAVKNIQSTILILIISLVFTSSILAQDEDDKVLDNERSKVAKNDNRARSNNVEKVVKTNDDDDDEKKEAEKTAVYYNNYLNEYKLGPQDIISVEVFQQCPDYCRTDLIIPPTAKVSYPLIREGVFVGGKTVEEVSAAVTKKLEEYIIDPKVTVSLVRAGSARYAVMGKVGTPGIRIMDRQVSINDAIIEAGGIAKGGDKKKVFIVSYSPQGFMSRKAVDLIAIEKGKSPTIFLKPGDQVFVGKKGFTISGVLSIIEKLAPARILFGSPF